MQGEPQDCREHPGDPSVSRAIKPRMLNQILHQKPTNTKFLWRHLQGHFLTDFTKSPSFVEATRCPCKELLKHRAAGGDTTGCSPGMGTAPVLLQHSCPSHAALPAAFPCNSCTSAFLEETQPPRHWPQVGTTSPHPPPSSPPVVLLRS